MDFFKNECFEYSFTKDHGLVPISGQICGQDLNASFHQFFSTLVGSLLFWSIFTIVCVGILRGFIELIFLIFGRRSFSCNKIDKH